MNFFFSEACVIIDVFFNFTSLKKGYKAPPPILTTCIIDFKPKETKI